MRDKCIATHEATCQTDFSLQPSTSRCDNYSAKEAAPINPELDLEILGELRLNALSLVDPKDQVSTKPKPTVESHAENEREAEREWKSAIQEKVTTKPR